MTIDLTGLTADNVLGAMAAFGVLEATDARMSWVENARSYHAKLHGVERDELLESLTHSASRGAERPEFCWADAARSDDEAWIAELDKATGSEIEDWLAALAHTPLDCMSGSFRLLKELRRLEPSRDQLEEALFGPWRYQDKGNPYGLDPEVLQFGAFTEDDPRILAKKRPVVLGAIWLALQAIPFFTGKRGPFRWCAWTEPLSADAAKLLLASGVIEGESHESRALRGIPIAFASERMAIKEGKNKRFSLRRASILA